MFYLKLYYNSNHCVLYYRFKQKKGLFVEINKTLTQIETKFNLAGSIPVIGILSGVVRQVAAKIQLIAGIFMGIIGLVGQMVHNDSRKWENLTHMGCQQIIHGFLNSLRALGEVLLGLTIIGSLGLLSAQLLSKNKFAPIVKYDEQPVPAVERSA